MEIILDYSHIENPDVDQLRDAVLRDAALTEYMVWYNLDRENIYELKIYGMMDNQTIFYTRVHKSQLRLELDFGVYKGVRVGTREPILTDDRYLRSSDIFGYLFDINGIKSSFDTNLLRKNSLDRSVEEIILEKCQTQGLFSGSIVRHNNLLLFENFRHYLKLPTYMYGKSSDAVKNSGFFIFLFNTILVISWAIFIETFLCSITAFALAKLLSERVSKLLMLFFLATMMVPFISILVPQFVMFKSVGLYNNYGALLVPFLYPYPYYIMLYKGFFDQIPGDFFDAARIDGANEFYVYAKITMGMSKPIIAVIALSLFLSNWNDFFWAFMVTESPARWTLNVALFNISQNLVVKPNFLMGLSVVTILPVIFITLLFSEQIKQSVAASGIKG